MTLPVSDLQHLKAAEGWLDLDNLIEANEELERIVPLLRSPRRAGAALPNL